MSFLYDKQIRRYCFFMAGMILLLFLSGLGFIVIQTNTVQAAFLEHENTIVTSLLDQGVSREIIGAAVSNTQTSDAGSDFLASVGRTTQTASCLLPFTDTFERTTGKILLAAGSCFSLLLLAGTYLFLQSRERLYRQTIGIIERYIEGDYSTHMQPTSEGTIYQLCTSIDRLATMLQSRNETEHQAKEFMKATISDISHQLKTPLAALTMYQEIIASEPDNTETVKDFAAKMGTSLGRMEQLISSMLKITRLDVGAITFEKEPCHIADLVMQAVSDLTTRADLEKKKILLDGAETETLVCDVEWTSEAIGNIVKNALDHTKEGGIIRISWECSPLMTRIRIADNGKGIAPEDIHHIFKRFYRSKASLDSPGIGLGLPLAKSIVEGQGGTVSVQSDQSEGTVFTISLLTKL
ncbi:MAG: HAMP domain-containing histidine kinase [Acetatifactor sp.]|nr:HAMP domain-containing histidine kinase [Acetatifactor sp.]